MRPGGSEKSFRFNAMPRPSLTGRFGERCGAAVCEVEDPVRAGGVDSAARASRKASRAAAWPLRALSVALLEPACRALCLVTISPN